MSFAACLKKDLRLLTGGGLRSLLFLLLPLLLTLIMVMGMGEAAGADIGVQSFDVAVRDLDSTLMSRLLTTQLEKVTLFKRVIRIKDETDEELLSSGCAATITIPKDFFYLVYDMRDTELSIVLNEDMPYEAAMVRSACSSLMGILEENQKNYYAAARIRFGELGEEELSAVYRDYSAAATEDALGRLEYFGLQGLYQKGFDSQKLFFAAGIFSMLLMFMPLSMLSSVSDETLYGLSERFRVSGGSMAGMLLSKLCVSFVMTFIPVLLVAAILRLDGIWALMPYLIVCFLLSFCFFLFIGLITKNARTARLAGNIVMLLMLTLGGAVYPASLLPAGLKTVSRFTLPGLISGFMRLPYIGRGIGSAAVPLIVMLALAAALFALSLPLLKRRRRA